MTRRHIVVAAALAVVFGGVASFAVIRVSGDDDVVPRVVGLPSAVAVERIERAGYKADVSEEPSLTDVEVGDVFHQRPAAGASLRRGETVSLKVLSGFPPMSGDVVLPPPTGNTLSLKDAKAAVQRVAARKFPNRRGYSREITCDRVRADIVNCDVVGFRKGRDPCRGHTAVLYAKPGSPKLQVNWLPGGCGPLRR